MLAENVKLDLVAGRKPMPHLLNGVTISTSKSKGSTPGRVSRWALESKTGWQRVAKNIAMNSSGFAARNCASPR